MLNQSRLTKKSPTYSVAFDQGVTDAGLLDVAAKYGTQTSGKYRFLSAREIPARLNGAGQVSISVKYDGEGNFFFWDGKQSMFFTAPKGRVRVGLPCEQALVAQLKAAGVTKCLLAGELYLPHTGGKQRPQVSDVIHASFSTDQKLHNALRFAVYDIIMLTGKDWTTRPFQDVWAEMEKIIGHDLSAPAHRVEGMLGTEKDVADYFDLKTRQGHEGLVVRRLERPEIFKIKPVINLDAVVIGYVEGAAGDVYGVTSLLCGLTVDNHIVEVCRIGSGFTAEQRVQWLAKLQGLKTTNPIQTTDSDGRPIQFVRPEVIVEVDGESWIHESFDGTSNTARVFKWDKDQYQLMWSKVFPRLAFPTFHRERGDKSVTSGGARVTQVLSPEQEKTLVVAPTATTTKILSKRVFVKGPVDQPAAVRKLLVIESDGTLRPPWVLHYTDYSADRADPHQTQTYVAYTPERRAWLEKRIIDSEILDAKGKIKRGWQEITQAVGLDIQTVSF